MAALSYVDDISISCPDLSGLNIILDICNHVIHDNCIKFNTMKTVCFNFGHAKLEKLD